MHMVSRRGFIGGAVSAGAWISGVLPTVYRLPFGCDSSLAGFALLA